MTGEAEGPGSWRRSARWLAGYLLLALATHTWVLHHAMQCDCSLFLRYAEDWAGGARLYADRYEPKSPVVFWLFRLIDSKNPRLSFYLVGAALSAAAAAGLRRGLAGPAPQAAPVAGLFLVAWSGAAPYQHLYDTFGLPFAVLTFAWLGRAVCARSAGHAFLAGLAFVVAVGVFPPVALDAVAFLPLLVWHALRNGARAAAGGVLAFLGGVAVGVGAVVGHAVYGGYWDGLCEVMAANREYGAVERVSAEHHLGRWWEEVTKFARAGGPLMGFAVVASVLALAVRWRSLNAGVRAWAVTAGLWLVASQLGAFPGGRHFTQYYYLLYGPVAVLGSLGLAALPDGPGFRRGRAVGMLAFALTAVGFHLLANYKDMLACHRMEPQQERTGVRIAAAYLNHTVPPTDSVLLAVWDRWAELYWQFRRPGPSRHVVPFNLAETRPAYFAEWAEDVLANPPEWVVTDDSTLGPGVTDEVIRLRAGGFGGRALTQTPAFDRLRAFVRDHYERVIACENLTILRRKR